MTKIIPRSHIAQYAAERRLAGQKVVFTNGCFDILHAGHVALLAQARDFGDCLVVGVNADAGVRRLKGRARPVNSQDARAAVLAGLQAVDAVCIFEEDTPEAIIAEVRPHIHVKGGDYRPEDLPEARVVREVGGEVRIVPLRPGYSTTATIAKMARPASIIIPARYGSTRFPGKPLADLAGRPVIAHVIAAALRTQAARPVLVATDDRRIAAAVETAYPDKHEVAVVMTSDACHTGTDRLAEALVTTWGKGAAGERVVVNIQGDEPFVNPAHIDALIAAMAANPGLQMATLATPLAAAQTADPNVVKAVVAQDGRALYFSRLPVPYARNPEEDGAVAPLRHLGVYAYTGDWLLQMAALPPSPLEQTEKLEQLRALEHGVGIHVEVVSDVIHIAIDTPEDLECAREYLR